MRKPTPTHAFAGGFRFLCSSKRSDELFSRLKRAVRPDRSAAVHAQSNCPPRCTARFVDCLPSDSAPVIVVPRKLPPVSGESPRRKRTATSHSGRL